MDLVKNISEIRVALATIKKLNKKFLHNYYINDELLNSYISREEISLFQMDTAACFVRERNEDWQTYFFAEDVQALAFLLERLKNQTESRLIIDLPGGNELAAQVMESLGFKFYTKLQRMSRYGEAGQNYIISDEFFAMEEDVVQIEALLYEYLDTNSDQLPERQELLVYIAEKRVLVSRTEEGKVASVIIFETKGKMIHWMFWATEKKQRAGLYGMKLYMVFEKYMRNFQRQLLFVHEGVPSMQIHSRFGFKLDGFEDYIYLWQRKEDYNGDSRNSY